MFTTSTNLTCLKKSLFFLTLVFFYITSYSAVITCTVSGNWSAPGTWSGGVPNGTSDVVIPAGLTVTMDGNPGACNSINISGTATWTAARTTNVGTGGITINSGGNITGTVAGILTNTGSLVINSTLTTTSVSIRMNGAGQTISGTGTIPLLDISAATTNNGNITVSTTLASSVLSTLTQGSGATLNLGMSTAVTPTLNATVNPNTVNYSRNGNQANIRSTTYHHLGITVSGTKTLLGNITVNGDLSISGSARLATSTFQITGNATGLFTMAAGTQLTLGLTTSATVVNFPTNFITSNITLNATSTVTYQGNYAQIISVAPTSYGNLTLSTGAATVSKTLASAATLVLTGTLTLTNGAGIVTLDMGANSMTVANGIGGTGALSFTTGNLTISGGNYTATGLYTCGTGTVTYSRAGTQTIKSATYYNLTISTSSTKTLGGAITVNNNLNVTGTAVLASSTFQITGNATGIFSLAAGTGLTLGTTTSATVVSFPTNFITSNISLNVTSTVTYNCNVAQVISSTPVYGNLTITTGAATVSKTPSANPLTVAGNLTLTNGGGIVTLNMTTNTANITGNVSGTGSLSFTSGTLNIGGSTGFNNTGAFTSGTGTVNYNRAGTQSSIKSTTYYNLTISGSSTKTLLGAITINNNLAITGSAILASSTFQIAGNATGTLTMDAGTGLTLGTTASATLVNFPTNFVTANITLNSTSTVTYNCNAAQSFSAVPSYGNLILTTGTTTAAKTPATSPLTVTGALTINNGTAATTLSMTTGTLNVTGNVAGTGTLTFSTGTLNIGGNFTTTTFTCGTGTVNYNGTGAQSVKAANYYNLTFSGAHTTNNITLPAGTINIANTFTPSATFTSGGYVITGNTFVYNGTGAQSISAFNYNNLTISGARTTNSITLINGGTIGIAGTFSNTATFTSGAFINTGNTINYNGTGAQTVIAFNYNNLTISGARTTNNVTLISGGTINVASTFTPSATFTSGNYVVTNNLFVFNGSGSQSIVSAFTFSRLTLSGGGNVTLSGDITINFSGTALTLTSGNIVTGANKVIMPAGSNITRTSGFIEGNLQKNVATGATSRTFEIGTGTTYAPITISFANVSVAGNLIASTTAGDHPQISSSILNSTKTVNRYWSITNSGISYTHYDVTCTFVASDLDPSEVTSLNEIQVYNGSAWISPVVGSRTSTTTQATTLTSPTNGNFVSYQIGEVGSLPTTGLYSIGSGNWSSPGIWSNSSGGASCGCTPTAISNVIIEGGNSITMDGNTGSALSLYILDGDISWSSAFTTNVGSGGITIAGSGDILTGSAAGTLTTIGGLTINKSLTSNNITIRVISTAGQIIDGASTFPAGSTLDISANTSNIGNLTINGTLASTTPSILTQGSGATLNIGAAAAPSPTIDANSNLNTVNYTAAGAQTIKSTTYQNLTISGSGIKTLAGSIGINNDLLITGTATLASSTFSIIGNASGSLTMDAGTSLSLGSSASATVVGFPSNFINSNIFLDATSTVSYNCNAAQAISNEPNYGNLVITTGAASVSKTISGTPLTVQGNLTLTNSGTVTFDIGNNTVDLAGNLAGDGNLTIGTGALNISGSYTNSGILTSGTGTIDYNSTGAQTVNGSLTYYNLIISGSGTSTLNAPLTVNNNLTISEGILDCSVYQITGNATGLFTMDAATELILGSTSSATVVNFPSNFTSGNCILNTTSTVTYAGNYAQTISSVPSYGIVELTTGATSVSKSLSLTPLTVLGDIVINNGAGNCTLNVGSNTIDLTGNLNGTGAISFTSGALNIEGTYNLPVANFTKGTGTINYNASSNQTVASVTGGYHHLTLSGSGDKSISGITSISGNLTISGGADFTNNSGFTVSGTFDYSTSGTTTLTSSTPITVGAFSQSAGIIDDNGNTINVKGNWTRTGGNFTTTGSTLFNGTSGAQSIGGSSATTFNNLTIDNSSGVSILTTQNLTGALNLTSGTFTTTGQDFTLISNASSSAYIPQVGTGTVTGDLIVQRYISGEDGWRLLSAPVTGGSTTLADWNAELIMTGFPGSNFPTNGFISVYTYDESTSGTFSNGYTAPSNITDLLVKGKGYYSWIGDGTGSPFTKTIDAKGAPAIGTQVINVTGNAFVDDINDGWNLIGNPYACSVNWDNVSISSNVQPYAYLYDPSTGNYVIYEQGSPPSGYNNTIPSHQAFWVKVNTPPGGTETVTFNENDKSTELDAFLKTASSNVEDKLTLTLSGQSFSDYAIIRANSNASTNFDFLWDAYKLNGTNPSAVNISSISNDLQNLSINTIDTLTANYKIPVKILTGTSGQYEIAFSTTGQFDLSCLIIEDSYTGQKNVISTSSNYPVFLYDTTSAARFFIYKDIEASIRTEIDTIQAGEAIVFINESYGANDYSWDFGDGEISYEESPGHIFANPGNYTISLNASNGTCSDITTKNIVVVNNSTSINNSINGISIQILSGPEGIWLVKNGDENIEDVDIILYNALGQSVHSIQHVSLQQNKTFINLNVLTSGFYLVGILSKDELIHTGRFLKSY